MISSEPMPEKSDGADSPTPTSSTLFESDKKRSQLLESIITKSQLVELKSKQRLITLAMPSSHETTGCRRAWLQKSPEVKPMDVTEEKQRQKQVGYSDLKVSPEVASKSDQIATTEPADNTQHLILEQAEEFLRLQLRSLSLVQSQRISTAAETRRVLVERLNGARLRKWVQTREDARIRNLQSDKTRATWQQIQSKRNDGIRERERHSDIHFASVLTQNKARDSLQRKQHQFRILTLKSQNQREWVARIHQMRQQRSDMNQRENKRNMNCEIHVQLRQRRLLEAQWRNEREDSDTMLHVLPPNVCVAASVVESTKTQKTGSSSHQARKLQEELLKEKQDFLSQVDREERVQGKLSNKLLVCQSRTPNQLEIERVEQWRADEAELREKLLQAKLRQQSARELKLQERITLEEIRVRVFNGLEEKRLVTWRDKDLHASRTVVRNALDSVSKLDSLIPTLHL